MKHTVHVPYTVEQDENGSWSAAAALTPDAFANGEGDTRDEAIEDLRQAVILLAEEVGVPEELVVTVEGGLMSAGHGGRDLKPGTMRSIAKQAGLSPEDLSGPARRPKTWN